MIIVYHQNNKVTAIWDESNGVALPVPSVVIAESLIKIAVNFPGQLLLWCDEKYKDNINFKNIPAIFPHPKIIAGYNPSDDDYLSQKIGYVSESLFLNVKKNVRFPTWQISEAIGGIHASVLLVLKEQLVPDQNFNYFLHSFSKLAMPLGMFCYSDPDLLVNPIKTKKKTSDDYTLFRFVKQHFKWHKPFLLLLNFLLYERKFPLFPFLNALFYKRRKLDTGILDIIPMPIPDQTVNLEIDVVIPTIGRKEYLYDFLKQLSSQHILPKKVIIVEQNPNVKSQSELDFLIAEKWAFKIEHIFTHQAGACNARNLALSRVTSGWVFLADDDILIENDFLEKAAAAIQKWNEKAYTFRCYQKNESSGFANVMQWETFGSGCSIVKTDALENCHFRMGYEFGFGEDADFGLQLRNSGTDVIYLPEPSILHLKAPIGGFRTRPVLDWQNEIIQPKPSPTIMLYILLHNTKAQLQGYKTLLFLKYYKLQEIKNPFRYYRIFKKQWQQSLFWAHQLKNKQQ